MFFEEAAVAILVNIHFLKSLYVFSSPQAGKKFKALIVAAVGHSPVDIHSVKACYAFSPPQAERF